MSVPVAAVPKPPLPTVPPEILLDRQKAFEYFKSLYPGTEVRTLVPIKKKNSLTEYVVNHHFSPCQTINRNKAVLRERYDEAKAKAEEANGARAATAELKHDIERIRVEAAVSRISDAGGDSKDGISSRISGQCFTGSSAWRTLW
jgi:hypothetical protein